MVEQKKGVILNMASVAASVGIADRFAYSTSKGAILTMTYQVAKDFVGDGIRCNSISPGRVDRKSTRLNSSHVAISYAVFCLKKKKLKKQRSNGLKINLSVLE